MAVEWKLNEFLYRYNKGKKGKDKIRVSHLVEKSGLSSNTVYPMFRGEAKLISRESLDKVLDALKELTGSDVLITDVLVKE